MTELLILNGAERDHQEEQGRTALHLATLQGYYTVVCLLVKVGTGDLSVAVGCWYHVSTAHWRLPRPKRRWR